jgi:hypothetical protein
MESLLTTPDIESLILHKGILNEAVLAERLRRTLKARVRKSVGSISTDCISFLVAPVGPHNHDACRFVVNQSSAYSSVGRAGDCRWFTIDISRSLVRLRLRGFFFVCVGGGGKEKINNAFAGN